MVDKMRMAPTEEMIDRKERFREAIKDCAGLHNAQTTESLVKKLRTGKSTNATYHAIANSIQANAWEIVAEGELPIANHIRRGYYIIDTPTEFIAAIEKLDRRIGLLQQRKVDLRNAFRNYTERKFREAQVVIAEGS